MRWIYNFLLLIVISAMMPLFFKRLIKEPEFKERLRQSFGFFPPGTFDDIAGKNCFWIHAASVGEVVAAAPVIRKLRIRHPDRPIFFTVVTITGYHMAHRIIEEADSIAYLPLDFPWLSYKLVHKIRPAVFVLIETELWPNLLFYLKKAAIPAIMINGRISEKSCRRYKLIKKFMCDLLKAVRKFCMQSEIDARHVIEIGANPELVMVTGNTKYDRSHHLLDDAAVSERKYELRIAGRFPVFIAGSTYEEEEEVLLNAFLELKRQFPAAVIIIAPRSVSRAGEISELCIAKNLEYVRKTFISGSHAADVVILDTIGDLGQLYGIADIVYVGGSLIKHGGHNILEPAAHGKAIITGVNMFNFREIHELMSANEACITVKNSAELVNAVIKLANDMQLRKSLAGNAARVIMENSGASKRSADEIDKLLIVA